jgi:hypothetical protein
MPIKMDTKFKIGNLDEFFAIFHQMMPYFGKNFFSILCSRKAKPSTASLPIL